jgi:hypothetical protein
MKRPLFALLSTGLLLASCAAPASRVYTLGAPAALPEVRAESTGFPIVYVARVTMPDYLDSEDILVRRGDVLRRSSRGRLATRLSLGATSLIGAQLARRYPAMLISDQPPVDTPVMRLIVNIGRLDVAADGSGSLVADWSIIPAGQTEPITRYRASFSAHGPVATDDDVVSLERRLLMQLADAIILPERSLGAGRIKAECRRTTAAGSARSRAGSRCRHEAATPG